MKDYDPRPMRIVRKGWFVDRDLTYAEAEAYHLNMAAKLVGSPNRQRWHLFQAESNREWLKREKSGDQP